MSKKHIKLVDYGVYLVLSKEDYKLLESYNQIDTLISHYLNNCDVNKTHFTLGIMVAPTEAKDANSEVELVVEFEVEPIEIKCADFTWDGHTQKRVHVINNRVSEDDIS